jgi:RHS repeat-associated protein
MATTRSDAVSPNTAWTPPGTPSKTSPSPWDGSVLAEQHRQLDPDCAEPGTDNSPTVTTWDWEPDTFRPLTQTTRRPDEHRPDEHRPAEHRPADERPSDDADQTWFDVRFHAIVTDLVGTPTELLAPDGTIAWHARTTLWGVTARPAPGEVDCPFRFPGQYHDQESGLHYNYHRHYDPTTARYETPDPLGLTPDPNPHTYVNNPLEELDPLGLAPCNPLLARARGLLGKPGDILVLGRRPDTKAAIGWKGHVVLNVTTYTVKLNDVWIDEAIRQGRTVRLVSPLTTDNLVNNSGNTWDRKRYSDGK